MDILIIIIIYIICLCVKRTWDGFYKQYKKMKKDNYIKHRLELSEELRHYIFMENKEQIKEAKQQIKELDDIIKIIF